MSDKEKKIISSREKEKTLRWEAEEFQYVEKSIDWYWIVGALGGAVSLVAFLSGVWTLGVLLVLSTGLLCYMATHRPRVLTITINSKHLTVNDRRYLMKEYESYYFPEDTGKLLLKPKSQIRPLTIVPLPNNSQNEKLLSLFEKIKIEEDEDLREPWIESLLQQLGF